MWMGLLIETANVWRAQWSQEGVVRVAWAAPQIQCQYQTSRLVCFACLQRPRFWALARRTGPVLGPSQEIAASMQRRPSTFSRPRSHTRSSSAGRGKAGSGLTMSRPGRACQVLSRYLASRTSSLPAAGRGYLTALGMAK